jgi:hypothetical protein
MPKPIDNSDTSENLLHEDDGRSNTITITGCTQQRAPDLL